MVTAAAIGPVRDPGPAGARLRSLRLRDWRNIEAESVQLPSEGIVLVGENGQGKTNLLEAIAYFHLMRSVRGARDRDCVRFGAEGFHVAIEATVAGEARTAAAGFVREGRRKRVTRDGVPIRTLSDGLGILPVVLLSPDDVTLVSGGPSLRRRFLDITLALTSRAYLAALQRYRGALARRNALFRAGGSPAARDLDVWEDAMAASGALLIEARRAWIESHSGGFRERCSTIGERARLGMRYASAILAERGTEALRAALERSRPTDARRGATHVGPHRDDVRLTIDDRPLAAFGSAGQQRTAAFALRMLEAGTLEEQLGGPPLLLLDDPFIELDARRAERIARMLIGTTAPQVVLAVPDAGLTPRALRGRAVLHVDGGRLQPAADAS